MVNQFPLQGDIIFDAKPDAVPYNYRISYKVSQLCLIMYICGWGTSCSLIKLHMISFALLSRKNMDNLLEFSDKTNESVVVIEHLHTQWLMALSYNSKTGIIN